ncbi:MAG: hypothetical protein ABIF77_16935 [bacterium]
MPDKPARRPDDHMSPATRRQVEAELASGRDETNPDHLFSMTATALLLAINDGLIDPVRLARQQLAARGVDGNGTWVGFSRAEQIHLGGEDE